MVRRRLCSITDVAPVAERSCSSTARTPWCSAPSTQRRQSLQLVKVGRRQGSTTDVVHLGWARLLINRMDTEVWCRAPSTPRRPSPRWARPRPSHRTTRFLWGSRRRRRVVAAASYGGGIARRYHTTATIRRRRRRRAVDAASLLIYRTDALVQRPEYTDSFFIYSAIVCTYKAWRLRTMQSACILTDSPLGTPSRSGGVEI